MIKKMYVSSKMTKNEDFFKRFTGDSPIMNAVDWVPPSIVRWIDDQQRYGVGYVTSDNHIGICMNDGSKIIGEIGSESVIVLGPA